MYLPIALQLSHGGDKLVRMGWGYGASLMQDGGQLLLWDVCYVELKESRLESLAHRFPPGICSGGVLGCKQHEVWVRPDEFLQLWHKQFSIVIQQPANNLITSHLLAPTRALHSMNESRGAISIGDVQQFQSYVAAVSFFQ